MVVVSGGSMSKVRIYEVAKQLNLDPKQVVTLFQSLGVTDVRNHMSSVDPDAVERVKRHLEKQKTHDVVEERIRRGAGTVLKRRAVAKQAPAASERAFGSSDSAPVSVAPVSAAAPSTASERYESSERLMPERPSASTPSLTDVASRRDISQIVDAPPSIPSGARSAPASFAGAAPAPAPPNDVLSKDRESARMLAFQPVPEERR